MAEYGTPQGVIIFGGADLVTVMSADGSLYVPYCGERAGRKFGTHVFKINPQGQIEWVDLPEFTEGRAGVTVEPDGLYLHWPNKAGNRAVRVRVPGFVTPGYPSSGATAPAPTAPPSLPAAPAPTAAIDEEARAYTSAVKKELKGEIAALSKRVDGIAAGGLNGPQVADYVWSKAPDAIYARLVNNDPGLVEQIKRVAGDKPVTVDRETLKALVRDVLVELLEAL